MYLLDTDTCVEILRGNERVISKRREVTTPVVTSEIIASELFFGAAKSREPSENRKVVIAFLYTLPVLPISLKGAQFFGAFNASGLETPPDRIKLVRHVVHEKRTVAQMFKSDYANTGHGRNKELIGLNHEKFQWSIVRTLSGVMSKRDVILIEQIEKEKHGSRAIGLNGN